ncbi:MAG: V-type ATP synthase subunit A [Candidatus Aenigmarchaeota archaeon]|nr:V-type ATP synthase subunit A [Candidatus Aenigmarchaeota archaeon]
MGKITRIAGHIIEAKDLENAKMNSKVLIGKQKLIGEIIKLENKKAIIQAFEDTDGLKINDPITSVGTQITATLGPGLIGSIFDGLQRPLKDMDPFIEKGISKDPLNQKKTWTLKKIKDGKVNKGDIIAEVQETDNITHKIFATDTGTAKLKPGDYTVKDIFGTLKTKEKTIKLTMQTQWPVYTKRPFKEKYTPKSTLITGQRVIDTMFPIAKGGCAAIPGGFGCGKTITTQTIAKFADADIVIMALVGERGNECADVLSSFPDIKDKKTGKSIMERSIIIANTSNMPVSARISSIYLATTIGEYYRDMGLNVLLIADSTSRWAEAVREISGMLEEMPGDEGYPAYLASKITSFYERSGIVKTLNDKNGSLTIMGTVSPPGGDFSEPVVQATKSITRCFWALRSDLAYMRHYPAIDWIESYSHYTDDLKIKNDDNYDDWSELRDLLMSILQEEKELEKIVRLVGYEGLEDKDKFLLKVAELFRENFLQQNAFHTIDMYCTFDKQYEMLKIFAIYYEMGLIALEHDKELKDILDADLIENIAGMKFEKRDEFGALSRKIEETLLGKKDKIDLDDLLDKGE